MKKTLLACLLYALAVLSVSANTTHTTKHTVKKGETLYSISKEYGVKVKDLLKVNPSLTAKSKIKPGQKLFIPGKESARAEIQPQPSNRKPVNTVSVPSTPETPYKDEDNKPRTNVAVDESSDNAPVNNSQPVINSTPTSAYSIRTNVANSSEYPGVFNQYAAHGYKVSRARGAANFLEENNAGNPYLALYNNAQTGSVIRVTNMMNKKTVYVKVVGRVPAVDAGKEVILKLSNKVAQELGARDSKFLVEVASVQEN